MRHATWRCAPLVSTARRQACRGVVVHSLAGRSGPIVPTGYRQLHLLSIRGCGKNTPSGLQLSSAPTLSRPGVGVPRELGQTQTRFFKKANYIERIGDNEKTEDILEALEVRDDEPDTRPSSKVLGASGEKPSTERQDAKWSEGMTKGKKGLPAKCSPANQNRENANDALSALQIDHPLNHRR